MIRTTAAALAATTILASTSIAQAHHRYHYRHHFRVERQVQRRLTYRDHVVSAWKGKSKLKHYEARRRSKPTGLDPTQHTANKNAETQIASIEEMPIHSNSLLHDEELAIGREIGEPDGFEDGIAAPPPIIVRRRPYQIAGAITVGSKHYDFVSGGKGWSIPYGDHEITPADVGRWGARHGAIGLDGDEMPDKQIGRHREGIEIHAADYDATEGCVGIRSGFKDLKSRIFAMIDTAGAAFLHVWPGQVTITPQKDPDAPIVTLMDSVKEDDMPHLRHHAERAHHRRIAHHGHRHYAEHQQRAGLWFWED